MLFVSQGSSLLLIMADIYTCIYQDSVDDWEEAAVTIGHIYEAHSLLLLQHAGVTGLMVCARC